MLELVKTGDFEIMRLESVAPKRSRLLTVMSKYTEEQNEEAKMQSLAITQQLDQKVELVQKIHEAIF